MPASGGSSAFRRPAAIDAHEASGATVTHVEDFADATLYSNVSVNGHLYNLVGTIAEA
ncbi:hypothetical protein ACFOY2_28230 [Nonomuraea purpurea]|uniref:MoaF-like domain-containing protein n=1 Tax=Nonomuraea purpurea TaxID=1849276 RepID=A0ABV8GG78_9ACTN